MGSGREHYWGTLLEHYWGNTIGGTLLDLSPFLPQQIDWASTYLVGSKYAQHRIRTKQLTFGADNWTACRIFCDVGFRSL